LAETTDLAAIDNNSFRLVLRQKLGFVLDALAKIDSPVPFMMPEQLAKTDPFKQITVSIGSGPFRFVAAEWVPGVKAVYERFSGYVPRPEPASQAAGGKVAKVDRIELVYLPDANLAADALIKGEVDILESPAPDLLGLLRKSRNVKVEAINPLGSGLFMVINHRQPPFDRIEARQALLWALNQADFMNATVGDRNPWRECFAMYGCGTANESRQGTEPLAAHDPAKAHTLLAASGYDGRAIVVLDPTDISGLHAAALMTAELLRRIGAKVDVQAMDWSTLVQRRTSTKPPAEGGWNLLVTGATISSISNPLTNNFARNCEEKSITGACEPRIVELTRAWGHETAASKRREIIDSLQRLLIEDVTYIPLGQYQGVIAHRTSLSGLINAPALFYWNIAHA
jgi:peptide/nickel transport system substrate-binding protein